jgi:hypothetical protein
MGMMTDFKKKWADREESKLQKMRSDLEAANTVVQVP